VYQASMIQCETINLTKIMLKIWNMKKRK
jgi:hypothetical protein